MLLWYYIENLIILSHLSREEKLPEYATCAKSRRMKHERK
jgi:hypothetical protein